MKKYIFILVLTNILCTLLWAQSTPGLAFTLINGGTAYEVYRGTASATHIDIPPTHNGLPVARIAQGGFEGFTTMVSITIPSSVTTIWPRAFAGCTGLVSITIPNSVTFMGSEAFESCTGLIEVTIPNSVTSIEWGAFDGCTSLTSITIPSSVTTIWPWAFAGCTGLTSVIFDSPSSLTSIGAAAFERCISLTSITIPSSVTTIGGGAFAGCTGLTSVIFDSPNSLASIGDGAFWGCTDLIEITIPSSVITIGGWAFEGCTGLVSITIPNSVITIGGWAFAGCTGLTSVIFDSPSGVTTIGHFAFEGCTGLVSITIPNSVTTISESAFSSCTSLTSAIFDSPSSVTTIGSNAFRDCTGLIEIIIPNSVTFMGSGAFEGCTGLVSITIPSSLTTISSNAFRNCTGLTSVIFDSPSSLTTIGSNAFRDCTGMIEIIVPNSVTTIGAGAFSGCTNLTIFTERLIRPAGWDTLWNPDNRPVMWGYGLSDVSPGLSFILINNDTEVSVARGFATASDIVIPTTVDGLPVTQIANSGFSNFTQMTSITIPSSVVTIGDQAFWGCIGLTSITIPSSVTTIGSFAFRGCTSLTSVIFCSLSSLTSIGDWAFAYCIGLTSITIPSSVTTIDGNPFPYTPNLENIIVEAGNTHFRGEGNSLIRNSDNTLISGTKNSIIPSNVVTIGLNAFTGCTGLISITIPNSVTTIGQQAFEGCTDLTSIIIPSSVAEIGWAAFWGCTNLIIYAEALSQPPGWSHGWHGGWNPDNRPVIWGYVSGSDKVTNLMVTNNFDAISLSWTAPDIVASSVLVGYRVERSETIGEWDMVIDDLSPTQTTFIDTTLDMYTSYRYRVIAKYSNPIYETFSSEISTFSYSLPPPTDLRLVSVGDQMVVFTWDTPTPHPQTPTPSPLSFIGYRIYRNGYLLPTTLIVRPFVDTTMLVNGLEYTYTMTAMYHHAGLAQDFESAHSNELVAVPEIDTSIDEHMEAVVVTSLQANYPNPFNPTTTIGFAVASEGEVSIVVYNLKGQRVRGLVSGVYRAGSHSVTWDGTDDAGRAVSSGVYFYRMVAGEYSEIKRMMLLK